jgi:polygalacturonase
MKRETLHQPSKFLLTSIIMRKIMFYFLIFFWETILFAADINVLDYGAVGDGVTIDSDSINAAIDAVSASGGGTVLLPEGTYLCRSIRLKDNVTLKLDNATIKGTDGIDPAEPTDYGAYQDFGHSHFQCALIWGEHLDNIKIIGNGTIDGNGALTKGSASEGEGDKAISLKLCTNVEIGGLDSTDNRLVMTRWGHFAMLITGCDDVLIHNIYGPSAGSQRDFLNLMQCNRVYVRNITIDDCSDDIIKLGSDYSLGFKRPSRDIFVSNIKGKTGCNVCQIGSETVAPITNVHFTDITCLGAGKAALGITCNDGAQIDSLFATNFNIEKADSPFYMKITNRGRCPDPMLGKITNVFVSNMSGYTTEYTSTIAGHREDDTIATIDHVYLSNVNITSKGGHPASDADIDPPEIDEYQPRKLGTRPAYGIYMRHTNNIHLNNVSLDYNNPDRRPAIVAENSNNLNADSLTLERADERDEDILFRDSSTYCLENSPFVVVRNETPACTSDDTPPGTGNKVVE